MSGKQVIERFFQAETAGDVDAIAALVSEDVVLELSCRLLYAPDAVTTLRGKEAVREIYATDILARGSSFRIEAERMIEEGDEVAAVWVVHRGDDGQTVRRGVDVFRIRDGKIVRGTVYMDLRTIPEMARITP